MKFDVNPAKLHKVLSLCKNALPARAVAVPILNNFLFEVDGGVLTVTASDTENTVRARVPAEGVAEGGKVCVESGIMARLLSSFGDGVVSFTHDEEGGVMLIKADSGSYKVPCFGAEAFPLPEAISGGTSFNVECGMLSALLGGVSYAAGKDVLRPALGGTLFDMEGGRLTAVSTDAHVLATGQVVLQDVVGPVSCIVPANTVKLVQSFLSDGDVEVTIGERNVRFVTSEAEITARLVDGKYPNYKAVIPQENPLMACCNRSLLMEALKRTLLFSKGDGACVAAFHFNNGLLEINTEDSERKSGSEEFMECGFVGDFRIGLDVRKLLSVLNTMVYESVDMSFSEPNRAAVITPHGDNPFGMLALCMPCVLD